MSKFRRSRALKHRMSEWRRTVGSGDGPHLEPDPVTAAGLLIALLGTLLMLPATTAGGDPSTVQFVALATGSLLVGVAFAVLADGGHRRSGSPNRRHHRW